MSRKTKAAPQETKPVPRFPVVGLGASAGGLEAFEAFFHNLPADTGMAFVLVPHLAPDHVSILPEILQRSTSLPVVQAAEQMALQPDHVYIIPPNRDMALFHCTLQLSEPTQPRGLRMPIDAFLRSLAKDLGEWAVGIILSGNGSDGTQGLRAIHGAGGLTLVQEPSSAKYDGMPTSAIREGVATHVLPPEAMPKTLLADWQLLTAPVDSAVMAKARVNSINQILMLLRSATGHDFFGYKRSTVFRRIDRRMSRHHIVDIETYTQYLAAHPPEIRTLFKELLISVTCFFRDAEAFKVLREDILPSLLADKPEDYVLRLWVAGCATGEEAYSIAILLREVMDECHHIFRAQIYATDLDDDAIAVARVGLFPPNISEDVSPERLRRFFTKEEGGFRIKKEIREMVVFAVQDIIKDPPFTKMDLVSCRNLMIYLETDLQERLVPALHYALRPGGVLFLSPSESVGSHGELFQPLHRKWKIFKASHSSASNRVTMVGAVPWPHDPTVAGLSLDVVNKAKEGDVAELTRRSLIDFFAPVSVMTDLGGNILYVHGDTDPFLRPPPGHATLNAVEMAREELQMELRAAVNLAVNQCIPTVDREVAFKSGGQLRVITFGVRPLPPSVEGAQRLLLISFQGADFPLADKGRRKSIADRADAGRIDTLERDLAYTRANLQATIEEQQSSNEELITVNAELQAKIEQLAEMQNDMKNLLDNINVGTVFLDINLNIRRFTREAAKIFRLVSTDIGRSLADIKADIDSEDLLVNAQKVLESLVPYEHEIGTVGRDWYLVRIQPYRTLDNVIDGVVLTFTDITARVGAEHQVQVAREIAEGIVDASGKPMLVLDEDLSILYASSPFYFQFGLAATEVEGLAIWALCKGQWDTPALRELLESVLPRDLAFSGGVVELVCPLVGRRRCRIDGRRIGARSSLRPLILLTVERVDPD